MTLTTMPAVSVSAPRATLTARKFTASTARSITAEEALEIEAHLFERLVARGIQHRIAEGEQLEIVPRERDPRPREYEGSNRTAYDKTVQTRGKRTTM